MQKKFVRLNDVHAYKTAFHLSNYVWDIVITWNFFPRDTIGKQFVTAVDSISANIAEGFGRHYKKSKIQFYRYSLGSAKESFDWNEKSRRRKLLSEDQYIHIFKQLSLLPKEIHSFIKLTQNKLTM